MEARLVRIVGSRRGDAVPLGEDEEIVLGRDPSSDLVLEYARISRQHAALRRMGGRHTLADLGSTNGTSVNGRPVHGDSVLLEHGDVIDLAGEVVLLYERVEAGASAAPWVALAAVMVLVLLSVGAYAGWRTLRPGPDLAEAYALARRGHEAAQAGDPHAAKEHLQEAAGTLLSRGLLEDVPRGKLMEVAMQRLGEPLGPDVDLWAEFQRAVEQSRPPPPPTPPPDAPARARGCRLDRVPPSDLEACLRERIEMVLIELHRGDQDAILGIPDDFHRQVGERMLREHRRLAQGLERGTRYVPMLRRALEQQNMPPLLHYLAFVESGYDPDAVSPARAVGLWQFMPGTARDYGLVVNRSRDERRDPERSTRAAARYLRNLVFEWGGDDVLLALASYNRGENAVRRALKKLDDPFSDRSYWRLVERGLLPRETAQYVPRFLAAAVAGEAGLPEEGILVEAGY